MGGVVLLNAQKRLEKGLNLAEWTKLNVHSNKYKCSTDFIKFILVICNQIYYKIVSNLFNFFRCRSITAATKFLILFFFDFDRAFFWYNFFHFYLLCSLVGSQTKRYLDRAV